MCTLTETRVLYALNYSIILHFNGEDTVEGHLCPKNAHQSEAYYFTGIQGRDDNCHKIAFFIDWHYEDISSQGFTSFACEIINSDVAIMNWLFIDNDTDADCSFGTDFLYSENLF